MNLSSLTYIFWLFLFFWCPTLYLWFIDFGGVRKFAKSVLTCSFLLTALCAPVEYWIVKEGLVLHQDRLLGIFCLGMPVEDFLFFLSFPFLLAPVALKVQSLLEKDRTC
jgi:lycopene cyclase domain-containing protein